MAREETVDETTLRRKNGQASKLYADFFIPHVIYTAVLSAIPSSTDQVAQISFGSGSGILANVFPDMLLKVGSIAGSDDLGIARIRKTPIAGTFYIGEQSAIRWADVSPVHLTVVDDYDLHAKHVRIDGTTVLMDYEIVFSDQHTNFSPVPVLGPIVSVGKIERGETDVVVQVGPETGYQSWVIGSTISSYLWSCATAASISSTSAVRPTMTFDEPGWHLIYCLVTAANGKTKRGVRYVYIWDDENMPLVVAQLGDNVEDRKIGGSNFELSFSAAAYLEDLPDRSLCVLFSEDYYGIEDEQEKISIGAVTGRENIVYTGRVVSESISFDDETNTVRINIQGYQELFKMIHGFPAGLRFKITPLVWTDMPSLTVDRALFHLLEYHTTTTTVMDFIRTNDTRFTAQAFSPFSSIWEQMKEFAEKQILANTGVDHLGRLFFEIDPQYLPVESRNYPVTMTIEDRDLTGKVDLPREVLAQTGQVNLSGVAVDNGGNPTAFFSLYPGHVHERTGSIRIKDRLLLSGQTQANILSGLEYAKENNPYKPMRVKFAFNSRILTCFPNQVVGYTISADKNPRGFEIEKRWIPRQRKLSYDPAIGYLSTEIVLEAETVPGVGIVGDIPGSLSDPMFPPLPSLPRLPTPPIILPGGIGGQPVTEEGPPFVLVHSPSAGFALCNNFDAGENEQEWYLWNTGLTTANERNNARYIVVNPITGEVYIASGHVSFGPAFIKYAPYAGGEFVTVEDQASINAKMGSSGNNGRVGAIQCNPLTGEVVYTLYVSGGSTVKTYIGSFGSFAPGAIFASDDPNNMDLSFGNNKWCATGSSFNAKLYRFSSDMSALEFTSTYPGFLQLGQTRHRRISTSGKLIHWPGSSFTIAISEDNGASITTDIGSSYSTPSTDVDVKSAFELDPTGQYICTGQFKSSDGGFSLSSITNLPPLGGFWRYAYAGDVRRFIAAASYIYYSDDQFTTTPTDKRGNILGLIPILDLDNVRVLEY